MTTREQLAQDKGTPPPCRVRSPHLLTSPPTHCHHCLGHTVTTDGSPSSPHSSPHTVETYTRRRPPHPGPSRPPFSARGITQVLSAGLPNSHTQPTCPHAHTINHLSQAHPSLHTHLFTHVHVPISLAAPSEHTLICTHADTHDGLPCQCSVLVPSPTARCVPTAPREGEGEGVRCHHTKTRNTGVCPRFVLSRWAGGWQGAG